MLASQRGLFDAPRAVCYLNAVAYKAAAALIDADPVDVALTLSVGYGVATAVKIVDGQGDSPASSPER